MAYKKSAQKKKQQELAEKINLQVKKKASPKKDTKAAKEATKKKIKEIADAYNSSMVEAGNVLPSSYYKSTSKNYFKTSITYLKGSISMFFIYLKKSLKK
jgi:hypothetical protein